MTVPLKKDQGHKEDSRNDFCHNRPVSGTGLGFFGDGLVTRIGLKCLRTDLRLTFKYNVKGFADETTGHPQLEMSESVQKHALTGFAEDNDGASGKRSGHKEDSCDENWHKGLVSGNGFGIFW
jgi:hypothetical protein